jgi:hypothetical protein
MMARLPPNLHLPLHAINQIGFLGTFIYLTFFDDVRWTWWNWLVILPANLFLSAIWPIYWPVLHWLF